MRFVSSNFLLTEAWGQAHGGVVEHVSSMEWLKGDLRSVVRYKEDQHGHELGCCKTSGMNGKEFI